MLQVSVGVGGGGFQMGGGASFLVEECAPLGGIGFDMRGRGFKKNRRMGTVPPHAPPHYGKP